MNMPTESKYTSPCGAQRVHHARQPGEQQRQRHGHVHAEAAMASGRATRRPETARRCRTAPASRSPCRRCASAASSTASMSLTPYSALRYIIACIMPSDASPRRLSARAALALVFRAGRRARQRHRREAGALHGARGSATARSRHAPRQSTDTRAVALFTRTAVDVGQRAHGLLDAARAARAVHALDQEHHVLVLAGVRRPARVQRLRRRS